MRHYSTRLRAPLYLCLLLGGLSPASSQSTDTDRPRAEHRELQVGRDDNKKAYKYLENDGIFVYYQTKKTDLYRQLLPAEFDMPDSLTIQLFVMDFYKIDSEAEPYKEFSISLLAKHEGKDVWHCVYMPVTSRDSMIAGKMGLGLPKTMGEIKFQRKDSSYIARIKDDQERRASITLHTQEGELTRMDEEKIKELIALPKVNLLRGKAVQMGRTGGRGNIISISKRYPHLLNIQGGEATLEFGKRKSASAHPFDLTPSGIIIAYYMHNKIPFRLGRKSF